MKFLNVELYYEAFMLWLIENWQSILGLLVLASLAFGGVTAYKSYTAYQNEVASAAFVEFDRQYIRPFERTRDEASAKKIITEGEAFFAAHCKTSCAPIVAGVVAQAYALNGDIDHAAQWFAHAAAATQGDMSGFYKLSSALVKLDSSDEAVRTVGLKELKYLADQEQSSVWEAAVYRLGEYAWLSQDYAEARLVFGRLLVQREKKSDIDLGSGDSVWVMQAREKMSLIA